MPFSRTHTSFLFGLPFDDLSTGEAVALISKLIAQEERFRVLVLDLRAVLEGIGARQQQEYFVGAAAVLCDSSFVRSLLPPVSNGAVLSGGFSAVEFLDQILVSAMEKGQTIGLGGKEEAILEALKVRLVASYPGLIPPRTTSDHQELPGGTDESGQPGVPDLVFDFSPALPLRSRAGEPDCWENVPRIHFPAASVLRAFLPGVRLMHPGDNLFLHALRFPYLLLGCLRLMWQGIRQRGVLCEKTPEYHYPVSGDFPATIQHLVWSGNLGGGAEANLAMPDFKRPFAIDLSGVVFIDSAGLGSLLRIMRKAWSSGMAGCFINPSPPVRRVLAISRLEAMLPVLETYQAAVEFLAAQSLTLPLKPTFDEETRVLRLVLPESLSAENSAAVAEAVEMHWDMQENALVLSLDCKATRFLDSSGLGCLLRIQRMVTFRTSAKMELRSVGGAVRKILKIAKLDRLFLRDSGGGGLGIRQSA